jgi:hypothetical protein
MRKADKIAGVSVLVAAAATGVVLAGEVRSGMMLGTIGLLVWLRAFWVELTSPSTWE